MFESSSTFDCKHKKYRMEEMLLRVCVVAVSLLYIKDHTVVQEQEKQLLMDLHEREYLLQNEAVKIAGEQEVQQVTTELPHSNQEVSQSQGRFTNAGEKDSYVPFLKNTKGETPCEHQMPDREDLDILHGNLLSEDIQHDEVPLTHDNVQPELQHSNFQNEIESIQDDDMSGYKREGSNRNQEMKTLNEEQKKDVQAKSPLNEVNDNAQKSSHIHQVEGMSNQMLSQDDAHMPVKKNNNKDISEERFTASDEPSTENFYNWYIWKFLSLISFIRLLRKFIRKGSQSSETIITIKDKTTSRSTGTLLKTLIPDHHVLTCFYDQHVRVPASTCAQVCEFVEGFVDELLDAVRDASNEETDMHIGDLIGVGSLYELWASSKTMVCDLYVPINAPRSHEFDVKLWKEKEASLLGFGKVKMVKVENISNGCRCMDGNPDDEDMLCLLHPHNETSKVIKNAVGSPLCQDGTSYLSKKQVVRWFRTMIVKAWREISHKYEFELGFYSQTTPGALKVRFRSGQTILFNITPVVQVKASDIYLLSNLISNQNTSETHWPISFAYYENTLLQYFNKILPDNTCHITCLQILAFLHEQQESLTGKCGLTSNHLKSTLLHLLMYKPTEWKLEQLNDRLVDMLTFLEQGLQEKVLPHALIGNSLVPEDIGLPQEFQTAKPTNIFLPMVLDKECYLKTVKHLQELVKNTPILIQEYGLIKSSDHF